MGFQFEDSELSPVLRRRVSELGEMAGLLETAGQQIDVLSGQKDTAGWWVFLLGLLGVPFTAIGIFNLELFPFGIIFLSAATLEYYYRVKPKDALISQKKQELAAITAGINSEIKKTSKEIFQELSDIHEARVHPQVKQIVVDFARIIEAARGRGIVLDTVECPNCKGSLSLPREGDNFQCQYCGKLIHATDIFEKLSVLA